jgi:hypothetical protein
MNGRVVPLVLALYGPALPLAAQGLQYEGGLSVASGTYIFTERTTSWSLFTGFALEKNRVSLRASLPVHVQNTTLVSLSGFGGRLPTGGSSSGVVADSGAARKRRSAGGYGMNAVRAPAAMGRIEVPASAVTGYQTSVGDPTAQLAWRALNGHRMRLSVSVLAKVPVADTGSFGTGQWDVGSSIAISQALGDRGVLGLDLTYWKLGDLSTLDFRDPLYGTGSVSYLEPNGWGGGISLGAGTSSLGGYNGPIWVGAFIAQVSRRGSWEMAGTVGLSETTPDLTISLTWKVDVIAGL